MRIVFHGENAASFRPGFEALVGAGHGIATLPDALATGADRETYAAADVVVGARYTRELRASERLALFQVPGAGYDAVDLDAVPAAAVVCNCFGHGPAIAEYTMAALLARRVPLAAADADLRRGEWTYFAGAPDRLHAEMAGGTIGLLGYGHIGQAIAARAKAFELAVHVANRSAVAPSPLVDRYFPLDDLDAFWASADDFVVSVPLAESTRGIVGARAFAAMRPTAVVVNVGRGATIDERALYDALASKRIAGAIIDTWYRYPSAQDPRPHPSALPFHTLPNVLMTPHMSGWTAGTIRRRQRVIAANVLARATGRPCENVLRPSRT